MDKKYNLKLDLQFRCNNSKMIFDEFDENTSDFFMQITRQGEKIDISNSIPTLLVLKPSGVAQSQILEVKNNIIYGNLKNSLKNEVGTYIAKLMLVEGDKKIFISNISYEVTENALLGKIDNDIVEDERYSVLLQLLERLSNIELQEQTRIDNENSRVEAENLRQEAIEKIKNDIANLINETNKKVNDNLNSNTSKIDNLIIDTKEELNKYKNNKDVAINEDLKEFKETTNKSIQDYKTSKDIEIDNALNTYKTNTTNDINSFKNTINSKIDKYKNDKDKAINEYIEAKSLELDNYVEAKNKEIDEYKTSKNNELDLYISEKNTLIDSKISEIEATKEQLQNSVNNKLVEVDNAEQIRQQEHEERQQFLNGFEGKLNTVVDDVATIKDDVVSVKEANKRQDIFLQGLYNENLDGRITVKEEGSVISLTNSDDGLVDIVGLEGNTLVNYCTDGAKELTLNEDIDVEGTNITSTEGVDNGLAKNTGYNVIIKPSTQYTVAFDTDTSGEVGINLGGSKVTTNNNVATVTTPSTLVDDTLRLTGKGIKASKVRLLEGDKTNWIPSYFEGMKSCFEDKLQEDGTYKMEITSANTDNTLSNKIQFSSIEPLRDVGDVKDRFVFKDGKLMIERNCKQVTLNGLETNIDLYNTEHDKIAKYAFRGMKPNMKLNKIPKCDKFSSKFYNGSINIESVSIGGSNDLHIYINKSRLINVSVDGFKQWLQDSPMTVTYELAEPIYEETPFELQKLILEGYENGTLFFDTNIPPTVTASYTANIPLVSKVNEVNENTEINTEDIAITQMAVDFLLMSTLGEEMLNFKLRSGYNMASYFANRIIKGALKYEDVLKKYPQYKEDIDLILISEGYSDLIVEL